MKQQSKLMKQAERQQKEYRAAVRIPQNLQPADPALYYQGILGNQGVLSRFGSRIIQAKLTMTRAGDVYEQEADRVADNILQMKDPMPGEKHREFHRFAGFEPVSGFSGFVPSSVREVLSRSGHPLDSSSRRYMEPRFGYDLSRVRVHDDHQACVSARLLSAHAYTSGNHIVVGNSDHGAATSGGRRVLAHEITHVIQQNSGGAAGIIQRDVVGDIQIRLSYDYDDWAITDEDALEVMRLLGTVPAPDRPAILESIGRGYLMRLLDNLPDSAREGEIYRQLLTALETRQVEEFMNEQLDYSLFDWAVTDTEVSRVLATFFHCSDPVKLQFLNNLETEDRLERFFSNISPEHHTQYIQPWIRTLTRGGLTESQRSILRFFVSATEEMDTLLLASEVRFNLTVGPTQSADLTPTDWTPRRLRRVYLALDLLPEEHVTGNRELLRIGMFTEPAGALSLRTGRYTSAVSEIAVNIRAPNPEGTITHEVAHTVDRIIGWSTGPEPGRSQRGGWEIYGAGFNRCAEAMVADSSSDISNLPEEQKNDVIGAMTTAMGNRSAANLEDDIRHLAWFPTLPAPLQSSLPSDHAVSALRFGLSEPWFEREDGGVHLGDHVYQESYSSQWVRYEHAARRRKVSDYQFRDPGEWFAEAYMFYYKPDSRGRGAKLNDHDEDTKRWFDAHVHVIARTRH